jgi:hypothetical protein
MQCKKCETRKIRKGVLSLGEKLSGTCPCGFSFFTPFGESEAVEVMQNHVKRIHLKDYPNGVTKAEAMKHIKQA